MLTSGAAVVLRRYFCKMLPYATCRSVVAARYICYSEEIHERHIKFVPDHTRPRHTTACTRNAMGEKLYMLHVYVFMFIC